MTPEPLLVKDDASFDVQLSSQSREDDRLPQVSEINQNRKLKTQYSLQDDWDSRLPRKSAPATDPILPVVTVQIPDQVKLTK